MYTEHLQKETTLVILMLLVFLLMCLIEWAGDFWERTRRK